jgi:hypothetical protein
MHELSNVDVIHTIVCSNGKLVNTDFRKLAFYKHIIGNKKLAKITIKNLT